MKSRDQLSEHDQKLLDKIWKIDQEHGWSEWPTISHLANQLEDEEHKAFWNRTCAHYNHMEEASIGDL